MFHLSTQFHRLLIQVKGRLVFIEDTLLRTPWETIDKGKFAVILHNSYGLNTNEQAVRYNIASNLNEFSI